MREMGASLRSEWLENPELDQDIDDVEIGQKYVSAHRLLALYDNLHFQYGVGILPEESWRPYRNQLRNHLRKPVMKFVVRRYSDETLRSEFLEVCEGLIDTPNP